MSSCNCIHLADSDDVTVEVMRRQVEAGINLVPHPACEKAMSQLQQLLSRAEQWEEKATDCLNAKCVNSLTYYNNTSNNLSLF